MIVHAGLEASFAIARHGVGGDRQDRDALAALFALVDALHARRRETVDVRHLVDSVAARDHHLFSGRLDMSVLGFAERAIVKAVRAPEGDFRDWSAIDRWAADIAGQLVAADATSG